MPLSPGTRLGPYEIAAPIGAGGMGEVYRARDINLDRHVAVKILPDLFAHDPERLARFEREAKTLAALNDPHIAQIYGFERADGIRAIVMELVEGPTLADRIAQGPLPLDEMVPIARQIAEALEAAHDQGIIHRDLKPANIKVRDDGTVKVLDFGLARLADPGDTRAMSPAAHATLSPTITSPALMTGVGVLLGTAAYMSPEQAKGRQADKRSDIWAFGCVLYEMLTGRRPFAAAAAASPSDDAAGDVAETLAAVLRAEPDWTALPRDTPSSLVALVKQCLHKDRRQRAGDIAAALFVLRNPFNAPAAAASSRARMNPLMSAAIAAGLAVLATSAAWWTFRAAPAPATVERLSILIPNGQSLAATINRVVAISRDGATVAYVASQRIHLRRIDAFESVELPIVNAGFGFSLAHPAFSPDGQSLAFYSPTDRTVKSVAVTGGAAVTLAAAARIVGMSWGETGIVFADGDGIKRIVPGGMPELIAKVQPDEIAADPQILPGGDSLLFTIAKPVDGQPTWDRARVVVQSLTSGQRTIVFEGGSDARYVPTGHLVHAIGGVLYARTFDPRQPGRIGEPRPVVDGIRRGAGTGAVPSGVLPSAAQFAVSDNGSLVYIPGPTSPFSGQQQLILTDRTGGVTPLKLPQGPYQFPRASPDPRSSQIVYGTDDGKDASVWMYDVEGSASPRKLTFAGRNRFPIWSSDGQWIAYQSDRDGSLAIFRQRLDDRTGQAERLTTPEAGTSQAPEAWSGDQLIFSVTKGQEVSLQILSIRNRTSSPFPGLRSSRWPQAAFSKDGRWVAYAATGPGETRDTLYVEPFPPTGIKYQVSAVDAHFPVWNGNSELLWVDPSRSVNGRVGFVSAAVTTEPRFEIARDWQTIERNFGVTASAIGRARTYDILPDGKRFVGLSDEGLAALGQTQRIQVVVNWFEELKRPD